MLGTLREDIASVIERDPSVHSAADVIFWHTGMHAVWAYRRAHWLWEHGAHTLASLVSRHTRASATGWRFTRRPRSAVGS